MRVFFASCTAGDSQQRRISAVVGAIENDHQITGSYIYSLDKGDGAGEFSSIAGSILSSDIYIAEMSLPSQTLGFQIAFALSNGKPCLYLYDKETNGLPAVPISGHPSRLLKISDYSSDTLTRRLRAFYKLAKSQLASKRTSFMSTHEIDTYLEVEARKLGIPKAEIIRHALHQAAQQNAKEA
jgi:hypothetical protein